MAGYDMAGQHLLCLAHSYGTSCWLVHEPLVLAHRLLRTSTEGIPLPGSLSGCHITCQITAPLRNFLKGAIAKSITLLSTLCYLKQLII